MTGMVLAYIGPGAAFPFSFWHGVALVGVALGFWYWFRGKRE